jgi:hypothetical protein
MEDNAGGERRLIAPQNSPEFGDRIRLSHEQDKFKI